MKSNNLKLNALFAVLSVCICLLVFSESAGADDDKIYRISAISYPGFAEMGTENKGVGLELAEAAFDAVNVSVEFDILPIKRAIFEFISGKTPMMLGTNWFFSKEDRAHQKMIPSYISHNVAFYNKKYYESGEITVEEALQQQGYATTLAPSEAYTTRIRFNIARTAERVVVLVNSGREKIGALSLDSVISLMQKNSPEKLNQIGFFTQPLTRESSGVVFDLRSEYSEVLMQQFEKGLAIIESNGKQAEIISRYQINPKLRAALLQAEPLFYSKAPVNN